MYYGITKDIFLTNGSTLKNLAMATKDLIIVVQEGIELMVGRLSRSI